MSQTQSYGKEIREMIEHLTEHSVVGSGLIEIINPCLSDCFDSTRKYCLALRPVVKRRAAEAELHQTFKDRFHGVNWPLYRGRPVVSLLPSLAN